MQSFGDFFANNRILAVGIVLAALAIILALGIALFRLAFGRRLHMSGGRTRQPRLGVVDAFDLDRQRQLVLVRRDNVEHLVMIGGPNDVVIETSIVRTAAPTATLAGRDKENGAASPSLAIPAPQPPPTQSLPPAPLQPSLPGIPPAPVSLEAEQAGQNGGIAPPPRILEPKPPTAPAQPVAPPSPPVPSVEPIPLVKPETPAAPAVSAAGAPGRVGFPPVSQFPRSIPPAPQRPLPTAVPRPTPASPGVSAASSGSAPVPRPPVSRATPLPLARSGTGTPQAPADRVEPNVAIPSTAPGSANQAPPASSVPVDRPGEGVEANGGRKPMPGPAGRDPNAAGPTSPPPEAGSPAPRRIEPVKRDLPPVPTSPSPTPRPPSPAASPKTPSARTLESLGSLEEEMAKLLGRPVQPSDKSEG